MPNLGHEDSGHGFCGICHFSEGRLRCTARLQLSRDVPAERSASVRRVSHCLSPHMGE